MIKDLDRQLALQVLQIRYWQHILNENLKRGVFSIPVHLAFGHEAIAVAINNMMQPVDQLVLSHRNVAYNLARAGSLRPIYDEYKLAATGVSGGKLGSMNLANPDRGIVYASSILGNNLPVACGLALGHQILQQPGIVILLTGDGAMEEGTFYESLVFARSQNLKCLFVVENNKYAMASTIAQRRCPVAIDHICQAVNMPFFNLSGNLVFDYLAKLNRLRNILIEESTSVCVEVDLISMNRHAGPTPGWPTDDMNIDLKNGLVVQETAYDPVFVLRHNMDSQLYTELENQVLAHKWSA